MKNKAAQALGRLGGKATSEAKAEAVRANGAKGGRPPRLPAKIEKLIEQTFYMFWDKSTPKGDPAGLTHEVKVWANVIALEVMIYHVCEDGTKGGIKSNKRMAAVPRNEANIDALLECKTPAAVFAFFGV